MRLYGEAAPPFTRTRKRRLTCSRTQLEQVQQDLEDARNVVAGADEMERRLVEDQGVADDDEDLLAVRGVSTQARQDIPILESRLTELLQALGACGLPSTVTVPCVLTRVPLVLSSKQNRLQPPARGLHVLLSPRGKRVLVSQTPASPPRLKGREAVWKRKLVRVGETAIRFSKVRPEALKSAFRNYGRPTMPIYRPRRRRFGGFPTCQCRVGQSRCGRGRWHLDSDNGFDRRTARE